MPAYTPRLESSPRPRLSLVPALIRIRAFVRVRCAHAVEADFDRAHDQAQRRVLLASGLGGAPRHADSRPKNVRRTSLRGDSGAMRAGELSAIRAENRIYSTIPNQRQTDRIPDNMRQFRCGTYESGHLQQVQVATRGFASLPRLSRTIESPPERPNGITCIGPSR